MESLKAPRGLVAPTEVKQSGQPTGAGEALKRC